MSAWGDYLPKSEAEQLDLKLRAMFGGILDDMTSWVVAVELKEPQEVQAPYDRLLTLDRYELGRAVVLLLAEPMRHHAMAAKILGAVKGAAK